jgi:3-methyladenine DNA glycosylase AlkD
MMSEMPSYGRLTGHPLISLLTKSADPASAAPMKRYMQNRFEFLGIKTPVRRQLVAAWLATDPELAPVLDRDLVKLLWGLPEREFQYAALDYLARFRRQLESEDVGLLHCLITVKSWWDTVDALASIFVGGLAARYPAALRPHLDRWAVGDNLWLRRTAILFQLKYKDQTDEALLYKYIEQNAASREFFIQKAIGWALREYGKTNPGSVRHFLASHNLARLSIREGSKHLG